MSIPIGTRLGPYEIAAPLGAGGMGEVYRARDSRLGRDVAIKTLPPEFASDSDRVARFQREAHILAALNHSNIAAIYGIEESGGARFLVLECVPGETLAERIARGPIPPEDTLEICRQIADGLEAGHEKGIVHRDLKPANIKITPEGKVKILDFGLAKDTLMASAASRDAANSPTMTLSSPAYTRAGVILGTAAYMSPEQARGKTVDKRSDIWAFGCILYECLAGKSAFGGESVTDTLASVIKGDPDWRSLPPAVTPRLRELMRRCLEKNPALRLHDIADVRLLLADALTIDPAQAIPAPRPRRSFAVAAACVAGLLIGSAAMLWWNGRSKPAGGWSGLLLGGPELSTIPRPSPDGHLVAFIAKDQDQVMQVWVMKPESGNRVMLTHRRDLGYATTCSWSLDGSRIYFTRWYDRPTGVFSVPALGGEEQQVLESGGYAEAVPDGSLLSIQLNSRHEWQLQRYWPDTGKTRDYPVIVGDVFPSIRTFSGGHLALATGTPVGSTSPTAGINIVDLDSGKIRQIPADFGDIPYGSPAAVMPNGKTVVYASIHGNQSRILAVPLDGGAPRFLFSVADPVLALDTGADGSIYLEDPNRPMEILRFSPNGGPVEHLAVVPHSASDYFAALPDGRVVWAEYAMGRSRLMLGAPGKDPVPILATNEEASGPFTAVGTDRIAFLIGTQPRHTIAIASVATGRILSRLEFSNGLLTQLAASPDGSVLYGAADGAIWSLPVAGGADRRIRAGDSVGVERDGSLVVQAVEPGGSKLFRLAPGGGPEHELPPVGPVNIGYGIDGAAIRDGRLVAPASAATWYWPPAIFDLATGKSSLIPWNYITDVHHIVWTADGKIVANGFGWRSTMWKFSPER